MKYEINNLQIFYPMPQVGNCVHCFLCYAEAFQFDVIPLVYSCFCCLCSWNHTKKILAKTITRRIFPVFFYQFYSFRSCLYTFNPCQANFCEWYKVGAQFHAFAYNYPVFPISFIKQTIIFPLSVPGSLVKYQLTVYTLINFIQFHWSPYVFMPVSYYFKIRKYNASSFVLPPRDSLAIQSLLWLHTNLSFPFL